MTHLMRNSNQKENKASKATLVSSHKFISVIDALQDRYNNDNSLGATDQAAYIRDTPQGRSKVILDPIKRGTPGQSMALNRPLAEIASEQHYVDPYKASYNQKVNANINLN